MDQKGYVTSQPAAYGSAGYGPGANPAPQGATAPPAYAAGQPGYQVQPGYPPGTTTVIVQNEPLPSMAGWIGLSCFVFWCCNCIFGAIAFFIALSGSSARSREEADKIGRTSMWVSVAGIIFSVVIYVIIIGLYVGGVIYVHTNYNPNVYG